MRHTKNFPFRNGHLNSIFPLVGIVFVVLCSFGLTRQKDFPEARISNKHIRMQLYTPDTLRGYYRGTRFDWAGVIPSLEYKGHQYFGQWFDQYNPMTHDAISGPVEEFTGIDYEKAPVGGTFLKIGVGTLAKPDDKAYSFARTYPIRNTGKRAIRKMKDRVEFTHTLVDASGYAYIYTKTVRLAAGKPILMLEHRLRNTGTKAIETTVYNHNFFTIDQQPTGPDIRVSFPFAIQAEGKGFGSLAQASGNAITYSRPFSKGENVFTAGVSGLSGRPSDYDIKIENMKTRAGVRITGDKPIEKLVYWACATTSCPEPYINISVKPGEETQWLLQYEFYTF
jgi:hypothetical protein